MKPRNQRKHQYRPGNLLRVKNQTLIGYDANDYRTWMSMMVDGAGPSGRVEIKYGTVCLLLERNRKKDRASVILVGDKKYKIFGDIQDSFVKAWL